MADFCRERGGVRMKIKRSLHFRPEWYWYVVDILRRRGGLMLEPLINIPHALTDRVDVSTFDSSYRHDRWE